MLASLVNSEESEHIKKRFYIPDQDEFNCSSELLNGMVLQAVLDAMPTCSSSKKALKHGYIANLVCEGGISPCSLLLGVIYIRRLIQCNQDYLHTVSSRDLFLVAMVIASKYMNDEGEMEALTNSEWSAISATPKSNLDLLERDFLRAIGWRLYVPLEEFYAFVGSVEARVALEQAQRRGWLSYTDLSAIWENMDIQQSMLKHTAKVAFSGVTLYLVCVSTLMAAMQAFPLLNSMSDTPTYNGLSHPLQQDPLQPATNLSSSEHMPAHSLLATTTAVPAAPPISWKEAWPGGGGQCFSPHPLTAMLVRPHEAVNSRPPLGLTLNLVPLTCPCVNTTPTSFGEDPYKARTRYKKGNSTVEKKLTYSVTEKMNSSSPTLDPKCSSCVCEHTYHQDSAPACKIREPLFSSSKVKPPQAEDLGYHYRGTFHWDPLNASMHYNDSGMAGALTFIVHYFTPSWIA